MNLRKSVLILAAVAGAAYGLAACSTGAPDLRDQMVGLGADQLVDCMGQPARKEVNGPAEVWTYYAAGGSSPDTSTFDAPVLPASQPPDDMGGRSCLITVKLEGAKIMTVDFENMAGIRPDEECSAAIQRCAR